jgi:hypothetical protein
MIQFNSEADRLQFLLEVGKRIDEKETQDDHKSFIKHRTFVVPLLKDFRRSQAAKRAWTTNKLDYTFGLRKWHHSLEGRRFHRNLGRFLSSRINRNVLAPSNSNESCLSKDELIELKRAILEELGFFHSISEQVNLELLLEEISEQLI